MNQPYEQNNQKTMTHPIVEDKPHLDNIYRELLGLVRICVHDKIEFERISKIVDAIIGVFEKNTYSTLLLHIYTKSDHNYIYSHIANNVILSIAFAKSLGLSKEDIKEVGLCAYCHDFGMVPYLELVQKPEPLTSQEKQTIYYHPEKSVEIFKPYLSEKVAAGILDIHEYANGKGYPRGKTAADISFLAKVVSICDVFEALTHPRNFRGEFSPYEAMKMIIQKRDVIFDKRVVKKFVEFMSIYPVGNLVYLNTGETGMVVASNPGYPTRSVIRILLNPKREVDHSGKTVDLARDQVLYINGPVEEKEEKEILGFLKPRGDFKS